MDPSEIVVLARGARLEPIAAQYALLFEAAHDSSLKPPTGAGAAPVEEVLGPRHWAEDRAAQLVSKLVANSAMFKGLRVLHCLEEQMIHEFVGIFQALRLDSFLRDSGILNCHLRGERKWFDRLSLVRRVTGSTYNLDYDDSDHSGLRRGLAAEYAGIRRTNWFRVAKFGLRRFVPLHSAWTEARLTRSGPVTKGGVWFFGAAYNTMAIGLAYGAAFPRMQYSFSDPDEGGKKLLERGTIGVPIFRFLQHSDILRGGEIKKIARESAAKLQELPLCSDEEQARDIYARSERFQYLLHRSLPWVVGLIRASERMLEATRPETIVVGNAAFERPLLLLAKRAGIPTVMLQHGVVHPYYRVLDQPVDHFLVRGDFFRECLGDALKRKAMVLDVPDWTPPSQNGQRGSDILFITSPVEVEARADFREVGEIVSILLKTASECGARLVIRVHPTESVARYRAIVDNITTTVDPKPTVLFSHQTPMAPVLETAAVVVLYHSTVFLECLAAGVPMVSPGWHDFPFKDRYVEENVFNFADDLGDLEKMVVKGLHGELKPRSQKLPRFLRPTHGDEVREFFGSIAGARV